MKVWAGAGTLLVRFTFVMDRIFVSFLYLYAEALASSVTVLGGGVFWQVIRFK